MAAVILAKRRANGKGFDGHSDTADSIRFASLGLGTAAPALSGSLAVGANALAPSTTFPATVGLDQAATTRSRVSNGNSGGSAGASVNADTAAGILLAHGSAVGGTFQNMVTLLADGANSGLAVVNNQNGAHTYFYNNGASIPLQGTIKSEGYWSFGNNPETSSGALPFTFGRNATGLTALRMSNQTTSGIARVDAVADTAVAELFAQGSAAGGMFQNMGGLFVDGANGGLAIVQNNASGTIRFYNGTTEMGRFSSSGSLGIGVDPTSNLHVRSSSSSDTVALVENTSSADGAEAKYNLKNDNGTPKFGSLRIYSSGTATSNYEGANSVVLLSTGSDLNLATVAANPIRFFVNNSIEAGRFEPTNGWLGVGTGTGSVDGNIHAKGTTSTDTNILVENTNSTDGTLAKVNFKNNASSFLSARIYSSGTTTNKYAGANDSAILTIGGRLSLATTGAHDFTVYTNDTERFKVTSAGDVKEKAHSAFAGSDSVRTTGAVQTTNATQTTAKTIGLADDSVYWVTVRVAARETGNTDRAVFQFTALAYRASGGGATLQGTVISLVTPIKTAGATTWDATVTTSGNNILVSVTGAAATTINWACDVDYQGVSGNT